MVGIGLAEEGGFQSLVNVFGKTHTLNKKKPCSFLLGHMREPLAKVIIHEARE